MDLQFIFACIGVASLVIIPILLMSIGSLTSKGQRKPERYVSIQENQFLYPQHWETAAERREREKLSNIEERQRLMWYKDFFKGD